MSWVSHWSATASTPMRGMPNSVPGSQIHVFTDSRISGSSGWVANRNSRSSVRPARVVDRHGCSSLLVQAVRGIGVEFTPADGFVALDRITT